MPGGVAGGRPVLVAPYADPVDRLCAACVFFPHWR